MNRSAKKKNHLTSTSSFIDKLTKILEVLDFYLFRILNIQTLLRGQKMNQQS